jgi:threonine dehydrogenase-like Zn-dependent dehydrogenase
LEKGRIALLDKPNGKFTIEEIPVPEPKEGGFLAEQIMCGVCGTDVHIYLGWLPSVKYPIVLGHEIIGKIKTLTEGVTKDFTGRPVKEGDLIYCVPGLYCGRCYFCRTLHQPTICEVATGLGFNPYPDNPKSFYGGYADYIMMDHPWQTFVQINAKPEEAVLLEPLSIGIHVANRVRNYVGNTVVIQGAGAVGLSCLIAAKENGAFKTIVVGAPKSRLEIAKKIGADVTISIEEIPEMGKRVEYVKDETEGRYGADVVIEATGVPSAIPEGIDMLRRGGTYVVAGHYTNSGDVSLNPFKHINNKHAKVVGVWGGDIAHFVQGRPIIESGKYPLHELVTHKLGLNRCLDAINALDWTKRVAKEVYRLDGKEVGKICICSSLRS